MFKYQPFQLIETTETSEDVCKMQAYNRSILASGVIGVECVAVRPPTRGERFDYEQFAPYGSMLSCVEEYANGAKNLYIRTKLEYKQIGVITVRPMLSYNAEKEYKVIDFKKENS
jgi:hypothetical protein